MKTKVYLCGFASPDLNLSVKRFIAQASNLNFYQEIKVFRPKDFSEKLRTRISDLFKKGEKKYYGLDIWRPEILINYLNSLPDNSILQYSDIGCHFNINGLDRLKDYVKMTEKNNMLAFQYKDPSSEIKKFNYRFQKYMEYEYSKGDVIKYFGLDFNSEIVNSPQIWGGTFFIKKCDFAFKFFKTWEKANEYIKLFDDSESENANHENFVSNRACQGVFSIICKLNKVDTISASECEWAEYEGKRKWDHLTNYPILAKRDKRYNIIKRFFNRQKKNFNRLLKKIK